MPGWSEETETTVTIFLRGPIDWENNEYYGVGEVQLPRRIFRWPQSDRVFKLTEKWMAERLDDSLLIFPLSMGEGDEGYEQFTIPLAAVERLHIVHDGKFIPGATPGEIFPNLTTTIQ